MTAWLLRRAPWLDFSDLPKFVVPSVVVLAVVALLPIALIAKARTSKRAAPRVEIIQNMDNQPRFKAQQANRIFRDGRAMRPPLYGTVAVGELQEDSHLHRGTVDGNWAGEPPMPITQRLMQRGQERYDIHCSPCHGLGGEGNGIVALRADALQQGTWVPPSSFHSAALRDSADGYFFNVITNGVRNMPAYGSQVNVEDRWAIVAYVRALQQARNVDASSLPADVRSKLR